MRELKSCVVEYTGEKTDDVERILLGEVEIIKPGAPVAVPVMEGLAGPWGIALDPLFEDRLFLAERDRVLDGFELVSNVGRFIEPMFVA